MKSYIWTIILFEALCLLGFIAAQANPTENIDEITTCTSGWQRIHRGCYMFDTSELEWREAEDQCKAHSGDLTIIQSVKEKDELQKYIEENYPDTAKWWVGLRRNQTSGDDWKWLDNHPLDTNVVPWTNSIQKGKPGKMCGHVTITKPKFQVATSSCTSSQPFICEYHSITPRPNTDPTTTLKSEEVYVASTTDTSVNTQAHTATTASTESNAQTTSASVGWSSSTPTAQQTSFTTTPIEEVKTIAETSTTEPPVTASSTEHRETTMNTVATTSEISNPALTSTEKNNDVTTSQPLTLDGLDTTSERSETTATTPPHTTQPTSSTPQTTSPTTQPTSPTAQPTSPTTQVTSLSTKISTPQTARTRHSTHQPTTPNPTTPNPTTPNPTTPNPTTPKVTTPDTPKPTMVDWVKALADFEGCYIPGTGGSIRDTVMAARKIYIEGRNSCPELKIGSISWYAARAGELAEVRCVKGDGFATFQCGLERRCWIGQPDINGCASKKLQHLLKTVDAPSPIVVEESIELSSQLVQATEAGGTTMEDVMVTSQVITALTQATEGSAVKDKEQVQAIVDNVVKAGSNLVSTNKSAMWEEMSQDDKVRSASTLLIAMETATIAMAQEINEASTITQIEENIELQLRVVDMAVLAKEDKKEIVYGSSQSESSFSIPIETLMSVSKGGLAKAVFMTHYSMSDILGGRSKKRTTRPVTKSPIPSLGNKNDVKVESDVDAEESEKDDVEEETGPQIASYILSASIGDKGHLTKLPKPITFTMRHLEEINATHIPLCSFWNVSQNNNLGFWSQDGCRVVRTNRSYTTCECDHLTNFAILLDVHGFEAPSLHKSLLRLVTIIGCVISCVSLLASWITFQCFTSLQGERNSIHKNLAFTLLLAELLFVFGIDQSSHQILCSVIAGVLHFFFLAAFTWMFIEGLHIIFMLVQVFDASRSRLPYYYLTGYGVPLVVVGASCLFYYKGYGTDKFCWLTTERYFVWAFAGPVAIILLVNAFFLTYAMSTVCRHADYVFSPKDKATGSGIRAWIQGALALEVLLGLTWTFGYFLINDDSLPLAYVFSVLNSLQGLFIFFFHCLLNKKAQKEYRQMARTVVTRSPSLTTTHSTLTKRTHHTNNSHDMNHSPTNSHQKLNTNNHSVA